MKQLYFVVLFLPTFKMEASYTDSLLSKIKLMHIHFKDISLALNMCTKIGS